MFGQAVTPSLPQADPLTGTAASLATLSLALAGVAALARVVMGLVLPSSSSPHPGAESARRTGHSSNPIPWGEKERLYRLYGRWAVGRAEADCPQGDVACVEREAKRLYEVRIARRR